MTYSVAPQEYLDRLRRMLAARGVTTGILDVEEIQRILAEVPPLALAPGRRYRIRTYGGPPQPHHVHLRDEAGHEFALDYPDVPLDEAAWMEFEATFDRRGQEVDGPYRNLLIFRIGAQIAALADMDVLSLELVA